MDIALKKKAPKIFRFLIMYSLLAISLADLQCWVIVCKGGFPLIVHRHSVYPALLAVDFNSFEVWFQRMNQHLDIALQSAQ